MTRIGIAQSRRNMSENMKWVAFFSQTGSEIVEIAETLGRWPDLIVTNYRPDHLRTIDSRIKRKVKFISNKPVPEEYLVLLRKYKNPVVTLHGWLRIVPEIVLRDYEVYNGHPGLITKFPELKGKDPQIRAMNARMNPVGCVLHRVEEEVDGGPIIAEVETTVDYSELDLNTFFTILRSKSLELWLNFLKDIV